MAMLDGHVKRFCDRCGKRMEVGERVNVTLCFELSADTSSGYLANVKTKAQSGKVCRDCAIEIAGECRLRVPREVLG